MKKVLIYKKCEICNNKKKLSMFDDKITRCFYCNPLTKEENDLLDYNDTKRKQR